MNTAKEYNKISKFSNHKRKTKNFPEKKESDTISDQMESLETRVR